MGSRRTTTRSSFGNGKSSNGDDVSGSSRSSGCSYLSNVRPGNRSTLCTVMAHLTEEKQPSFVTTLKSKAVSESCNVKFSCVVTGYPAPQVTWYKDDVQLDRYCGLPKYEIFRNGQNHSLHIYKCTVDDAAIYQASAINNKGIVSCSGVLEVGEMNEFKIHQRYFSKLKQKAENRRRETEGKENQEPLRTISPDRTQRKRRSTMEAFLSTPSSMEDEGSEENHQIVALKAEARLQEVTVEEDERKPAPITNGAVPAMTKGQTNNDSGCKSGTYIYDPDHKIFTPQHPKSPFVKKKIKISTSANIGKSDIVGETMSTERRTKDETPSSVAPACTKTLQTKGNPEEVMEVEDNVSLSDSSLRDMDKRCEKTATVTAVLTESPSKDENICMVTESSQIEHLSALVFPAALLSPSHIVSGTETEKVAKYEKEGDHKVVEENLEMQSEIPDVASTQKQSSVTSTLLSRLKEDIHTTESVTCMAINGKSKATSDGCFADSFSESVDIPCDSRIVLSRRPCELAGNQLSEKEASPCQKMESVSRPAVPSEVTQPHAKMNGNGAPVNLKLPPDQCTIGSQMPQKTDDIQTSSLCKGLQPATDEMAQDSWENSRESNESCSSPFTNLHKSSLERPGGGENTPGCNVSLATLQSQVDTAIKTVEGTEIKDVEKVEGNDLGEFSVQADTVAPNEKTAEMEMEIADLHKMEQSKTKKAKDAKNKVSGKIENSYTEAIINEPISKVVEKTNTELLSLKSDAFETAVPLPAKMPENTISLDHSIDFKEIPKPVTKVISIAELLRSQIKALNLTLANSVSSIPVHANLEQDTTITHGGVCQESKDDNGECEVEGRMSKPDKETETDIVNIPPINIKTTLMEIYQQLNESEHEQILTSDATLTPVQDLHGPHWIVPSSLRDTDTAIDITGLHESARKYNEVVMDLSEESETTAVVPIKASSVVGSKNVQHSPFPMTSDEDSTNKLLSVSNQPETVIQESGSPLTVTHMKASIHDANATIFEQTKDKPIQGDNVELMHKLIPEIELNINMKTPSVQNKLEEHNTNRVSLQQLQKYPSESEFSTGSPENQIHLVQHKSSIVGENLRSDSFNNLTPEPSPRLKKRNHISPIPSATPQELASGARRKILTPKAKPEEGAETSSVTEGQNQKKEAPMQSGKLHTGSVTVSTSPSLSRRSPLLKPAGEQTSPVERQSPLLTIQNTASETQTPIQLLTEDMHTDKKPAEKDKHNPFKAPQVIRKIRAETFADASGHLKLWCQFFNVLSDSTIKWYKNEEEIAHVKRNAGEETQVNLAIVQASSKDSGVYGCSITNDYGTDSTDFLLSAEILLGMSLREDLGVGEEIEMTPLIFNKGLADSGVWGNKFFGRIMMIESHIGNGCSNKVWRAKVIYGLEPVFESGNTCIIKVRSPITYGGKEESCLIERNLDIMKQKCRIQNLAREYCKIFSAEARVIEGFGPSLEVIPVYLMYRPANAIPYATVETDLTGMYKKYTVLDDTGRLYMTTGSEVELKCCALQHWIFQWTNGNLLFSRLEGVDTKITSVGISVKSTGHQGFSVEGNPKVFEQFVSQHNCNYFCGLLGLRSPKIMDSLMTPTKPKGSRSPQCGRKAAGSPRLPRKAEQNGSKTPTQHKATDAPSLVRNK
ncbi:alpha-protein kinase 3 [Leuresthes tenuis]|uniref:alpha-protein kinase 3 n=1 Tax=Leuresthes tenuis TaxID=355514 RepID=UPI003B50EBC1